MPSSKNDNIQFQVQGLAFQKRQVTVDVFGVHGRSDKVTKTRLGYQSVDVLFATENNFGHVIDLEGGIGTLTGQVGGAGRFVVVDSVAVEAGLDSQVVLDGSQTGQGGC